MSSVVTNPPTPPTPPNTPTQTEESIPPNMQVSPDTPTRPDTPALWPETQASPDAQSPAPWPETQASPMPKVEGNSLTKESALPLHSKKV